MKPIRVAVDPILIDFSGARLHWALRQLISGCGWSWQEVSLEDECDLALVASNQHSSAKVVIQSDLRLWNHSDVRQLDKMVAWEGLILPSYKGIENASEGLLSRIEHSWMLYRDVIYDFYWLVTGQHEAELKKDSQGFFDLADGTFKDSLVFREAIASRFATWFQQLLIGAGCSEPLPRWPEGKKAALCSGHDVDYPEVIRYLEPLRVIARQGLKGVAASLQVALGTRHHWHFQSWINLENEFSLRSAFYFVPRQGSLIQYATGTPDPFYDIKAPRFDQLFKLLNENDYEVGMHASYMAYQNVDTLIAEKNRLEEASGTTVVGNRHHYWHLNPADPEQTLLFHEKAGFLYDASLVHNRYIGWRRHTTWPYFPFHQAENRELRTLQIPVSWMDDHLFGFKNLNPGENLSILQALAQRTVNQGGCFTIDIHDYVFDPVLFPGWSDIYREFLAYLQNRGDFWFALPKEICQHWSSRYRSIINNSQGLSCGLIV
jgi:hypothetical protein